MKKHLVLGALLVVLSAQAQQYSYQYGSPYEYQQNSNWQYYDDGFYNYAYNHFPDEYYYEYPIDYYPVAYYESYYNDYQQSITGVNWKRLFVEFRLSPFQIHQITILNNRFSDFSFWYDYYGMNPDRWYYDRFYALERILGTRNFVIFQNRYYNGYAPVVYFKNYKTRHYARRYHPVGQYQHINVNIYNIGRDRYFEHYGNGYMRRPKESPFRSDGFTNSDHRGFRKSNGIEQNYRSRTNNTERSNNRNYLRGHNAQSSKTNNENFRINTQQRYSNGFRTGGVERSEGFRHTPLRNEEPSRRVETNKAGQRGFGNGGFR